MLQTLDLSQAPPILFLFGLSGSGKSYIGQLLAKQSGRFFYDADQDITEEMRNALANQQPFTNAMRDRYFAQLALKITSYQSSEGALVVSQAVYRERHRQYLLQQLAGIEFIFVSANDATILQRLRQRADGITPASAAALRQDFEFPDSTVKALSNDSTENPAGILAQVEQLYKLKSLIKKDLL